MSTNRPTEPEPSRRVLPLIAVLAAVALLAPTTGAYHLSVGAEDTIGLEKSEPPANTDPQLYERGTRTDCPDPEPTDPSTATADGFCGNLVYNEGTPYVETSPEDQVRRFGVSIDLQMTTYVGLYGTSTCSPWCNENTTYHLLHDLGEDAGVLERDSDDVDDGGTQAYGGNVYAASPMQAYAALGQQWLIPVTDTSFVAFVTDSNGDPVGEQQLETTVATAKQSDVLANEARAKVCVFTPNANLGTHAPSSGSCEVTLDWMGDSSETEPCQSETYVCGAVQPAWRGTTMCPMWHAACYISDAWNSAHHFAIWHGVVAPSPPEGCLAREPGFATDTETFLAHDLDVYEPPTDETPATGVPHYWDAAAANVPGLGPTREGRAPNVADTPVGQQIQATPAFAQHDTEPNTDGWLGIPEDSQTRTHARSLTDCQRLASGEQTADPWVNIVDAHVTRDVAGFGTPAGAQPEPDHDPKPAMRITGKVGLFTDVDDDGEYEQAPGSDVLDEVREFGAYPILWDYHPEGEGCSFRAGDTIGTLANQAGYTAPTGLVSVLRLSDGAVTNPNTGQTIPIAGPTAVVLLSSGLDGDADVVQTAIDRAAGDRPTVVIQDGFMPQCGEPTGGFTSPWEILGEPMEGDGLATAAVFTLEEPLGEDSPVPASPMTFDQTTHVWWDVDPFEPAMG